MPVPMANQNIRDLTVDGSGFRDQFDGKLMNPMARETQDTVTGTNETKEYVTGTVSQGPLGSTGRH